MAKQYNLYHGDEPITYYNLGDNAELNLLKDDPSKFKAFKKIYEDEINILKTEKGEAIDKIKLVEEKNATLKADLAEFQTFLKDILGFDKIEEAKNALGGDKLNDLLITSANQYKTITDNNTKLQKDICLLNTKIAGMVDRRIIRSRRRENPKSR